MWKLISALYAACLLIANPAIAGDAEKWLVHGEPRSAAAVTLDRLGGGRYDFAENVGSYRLVNFWALWCATCRKEMPSLDALAGSADGFDVITVAAGRNDVDQIQEFFDQNAIKNLPVYLDPRQKLASRFGVSALPHSVILDPEGREIARYIGGADYQEPAMIARIKTIISNSN